jgi:hypothetical protein
MDYSEREHTKLSAVMGSQKAGDNAEYDAAGLLKIKQFRLCFCRIYLIAFIFQGCISQIPTLFFY